VHVPETAARAAALAVISAAGLLAGAPLASTETKDGKFIVKCGFSHRKHVDPIVAPGKISGHLHDFYGNRSTAADSTYTSMTAARTTCTHSADTAAYWAPTIYDARNRAVKAVTAFAYYRNKPVRFSKTVPFPADFRMLAGGVGTYPATFWKCFRQADVHRYRRPPKCVGDFLVGTVLFPNCWDGVRRDSRDHRSHVTYPVRSACPATHPVKLPDVRFFVRYPKGSGGRGWHLSDGTTALHADYWNTWRQPTHERPVRDCLNAGVDCGRVRG
jgi:hypothetical protein